MSKKIAPATSFIPKKTQTVMLSPRVTVELKSQMEAACAKLDITIQDLVEGAIRRYLEELRTEGAIQ